MRVWVAATLILSCGCSGSDETPITCADDEQLVGGRCVPADGCPQPGIQLVDGTCAPVGIPAEACAEGFTAVDGACEPVLPAEPCAAGMMAIPGEESCRPVMDCPAEPWGGIDPGPTPQWVDGSYTGGSSDGTQARPWPTIQEAVTAAAPGAVIAIAAGSYVGNLAVQDKAVHLQGVCPGEVEILGVVAGNGAPAVVITGTGANGSSLAGLAVTGPAAGISMSGVTDVRLDRVWVHDTGDVAVDVEDPLGPASVTVADSLIERAAGRGLLTLGAAASLDRSVVRGTLAGSGPPRGVHARVSNYSGGRAWLSLSQSLVTANEGEGVFVVGSEAVLDGTVVRDSLPAADGRGQGLAAQVHEDTGQRADVQLRRSAILDNHLAGLMVFGSVMRVEQTLVRGTLPQQGSGGAVLDEGRGINLQDDITGDRATVDVVSSTLDQHHGVGLFAVGTDLTISGTLIRDILDAGTQTGRGINLQPGVPSDEPVVATIGGTLVERVMEFGVLVGGSQAVLQDSVVRDITANPKGLFGDGIAVLTAGGQLDVVRSTVEHGARAGLSVFGGAAVLSDSRLWCHPINIAVQAVGQGAGSLTDLGGNQCGCEGVAETCQAAATDLEPPAPL